MRRLLLVCTLLQQSPNAATVRVILDTALGPITVDVDVARAPITATNFLRYVDGGFYDGGRFHRAVRPGTERRTDYPIQVVQAGINPVRRAEAFPPIALERTSASGLTHVDGVISMARDGPDTARSDFFLCIGNQPELDFGGRRNADGQGFAAFGRVVAGMDVVTRIQAATVRPGTETLDPPITILKARRAGLPGMVNVRAGVPGHHVSAIMHRPPHGPCRDSPRIMRRDRGRLPADEGGRRRSDTVHQLNA